MKEEFKGVIKLDVRDSIPDWDPYTPPKSARGSAQHPVRPVRRHRAGGLVAVRRRDQHADAAEAGRQRPDVLAVAHDGAVLADPLHAPDRAQPSPERHGLHHRGGQRVPRRHMAASRSSAPPSAQILQDGGWSTFWVGKNHNVPEPDVALGRQPQAVAAQQGLRSLLRLHRRRDQPVVSRPRRRQPLHRAAVRPGRGLSPLQGPGRQGHPDDPRPEGQQSLEAVVHVVLPGANHAPHHCPAGVHRQVQGQVRRRLRGLPRVGPAAHDREGHPARGHPAHADQPDAGGRGQPGRRGAPLEHAQRRREEAVLAHGRGLRRILGVHRRPGRPHHRLPGEERPARKHHRPLRRRQRRLRRGQPQRLGQREQVLQRLPG